MRSWPKWSASAPATCHRRTQRLFDEGYISQVRAMVAPRKVGKGALVMVGVVLDRSTPESFAAFERAIAQLKFVLDCHLVAGDFDYFLKIRVGDMEDFNRIHGEQLIALPGRPPDPDLLRHEGSGRQRTARFLIVFGTTKRAHSWPDAPSGTLRDSGHTAPDVLST